MKHVRRVAVFMGLIGLFYLSTTRCNWLNPDDETKESPSTPPKAGALQSWDGQSDLVSGAVSIEEVP